MRGRTEVAFFELTGYVLDESLGDRVLVKDITGKLGLRKPDGEPFVIEVTAGSRITGYFDKAPDTKKPPTFHCYTYTVQQLRGRVETIVNMNVADAAEKIETAVQSRINITWPDIPKTMP